ncbi:MAG: 4Fe-4S binding protein, partial [candidate division WOR-3 bacterium]
VLVFRRPCALISKPQPPYQVDTAACKGCRLCMAIGCPALRLDFPPDRDKPLAVIDDALCVGCGLCAQVCTCDAIASSRPRSETKQ